jgi:hypothetical protein
MGCESTAALPSSSMRSLRIDSSECGLLVLCGGGIYGWMMRENNC